MPIGMETEPAFEPAFSKFLLKSSDDLVGWDGAGWGGMITCHSATSSLAPSYVRQARLLQIFWWKTLTPSHETVKQ